MNKEMEIFGRKYIATSSGEIIRPCGKTLSQYDRKGYKYVLISDKGKRKKIFVHRLIAAAFFDNADNCLQVNHIDGNPLNNCSENLEWVTGSQNQLHSRYILHNETGFKDVPVRCVETNEKYISTRDAWRKTGISFSHISECANGKRKTAGGYKWERLT